MNRIRSCLGSKWLFWSASFIVWVVLFLCIPSWLILHLLPCRREQTTSSPGCTSSSMWLYGYWLGTACISILVFSVAVCCWKRKRKHSKEDILDSSEFLLSPKCSVDPLPLRLIPVAIQPKRDESEIVHVQSYMEVNAVSHVHVQPPFLSSKVEFSWDFEGIPWIRRNTRPSMSSDFAAIDRRLFTSRITETNVQSNEINYNDREIIVESNFQQLESSESEDNKSANVEHSKDYYCLTPNFPISPVSKNFPSSLK